MDRLGGAGGWARGGFQFQAAAYQYWTRVAPDGSFTIPAVRTGTYTLYAFNDGAVGEYSTTGVEIKAGAPMDLGDLTWEMPHQGKKIAWEIGTPDRSSAEFKHGKEFFQPLIYWQVAKDFPNPLEYDVDKSNPATDWNYAQSFFLTPDGQSVPQEGRIHFRLATVPDGNATLTIALASAEHAKIDVFVNDDGRPFTTVDPKFQGGNALVRQSDHAKYDLELP